MNNFKVWLIYINHSMQNTFVSIPSAVILLLGKILRTVIFVIFLYFLLSGTRGLLGYDRDQVIFFYLTFSLIDTLGQLLFREVYRFRQLVVEGNLDFVLIKPFNPLTKVLLGGVDILDVITLIPLIGFLAYFITQVIGSNPYNLISYILLIINGLIIAMAFHILVLGLGILTTTVDHMIFIYRDLTSLLRFPVDIYKEPVRSIFTFIIPLGVMFTFPAKALMGLLNINFLLVSLGIGVLMLGVSLIFWKFSLRHYQSASS